MSLNTPAGAQPDPEGSLFAPELTYVGLDAATSEQAIRTLAQNFIKLGYVHPSFPDAVITREGKYPTGLPTEIPVGLPHTDVEHCIRPGISVAILKNPVTFQMMGDPTQTVSTNIIFLLSVVTPANQVKLLTRLIDFFQQSAKLQKLASLATPQQVVDMLQGELEAVPAAAAAKPAAADEAAGHSFEAVIHHPAGLHARPAAKFVQTAAKFIGTSIKITNLEKQKPYVDAKSIISVLTLEIGQGNRLRVTAEGQNAAEALQALQALIDNNFGE